MDNRGMDPIRYRSPREDERRDHARVERPNRRPKERDEKKFKDLVDKDEEDNNVPKQRKGKVAKKREESRGGGSSIFDLSAQADKKKSDVNLSAQDEKVKQGLMAEEAALSAMEDAEDAKKRVKAMGDIDGSMAGQSGGQLAFAASASGSVAKAAQASNSQLHALIEKLTEELSIVKQAQKTDTTFTLKHPPLFAGVTVQVTEFASARGEFNIAFNNLSAQAQALIDSLANQQLLKDGLAAKGFALHIVTSSTEPAPVAETAQSEKGRGDEQDRQDQRDQREDKEEQSRKQNS